MAYYPRRRITTTGCILLGLGLALLLLPVDQKSYARKSAKNIRGAFKAGKWKPEPEPPKGGMVRLKEITPVPVNDDGGGVMKQVMILNGQVPHLTGFERSVFTPGDEVGTHSDATMDGVFYGEQGKGTLEVDGIKVEVTPGTCVYVAAGQKHSLKNHGDEDWAILFFGVATEPEGAGTSKRDGPISANALHAINP